jgi:hypothetical protein
MSDVSKKTEISIFTWELLCTSVKDIKHIGIKID